MKVLKKIANAGASTGGSGDGAPERDRRDQQGDGRASPDAPSVVRNFGRAGCGQPGRRSPMLALCRVGRCDAGREETVDDARGPHAPRRHHVEEAL